MPGPGQSPYVSPFPAHMQPQLSGQGATQGSEAQTPPQGIWSSPLLSHVSPRPSLAAVNSNGSIGRPSTTNSPFASRSTPTGRTDTTGGGTDILSPTPSKIALPVERGLTASPFGPSLLGTGPGGGGENDGMIKSFANVDGPGGDRRASSVNNVSRGGLNSHNSGDVPQVHSRYHTEGSNLQRGPFISPPLSAHRQTGGMGEQGHLLDPAFNVNMRASPLPPHMSGMRMGPTGIGGGSPDMGSGRDDNLSTRMLHVSNVSRLAGLFRRGQIGRKLTDEVDCRFPSKCNGKI